MSKDKTIKYSYYPLRYKEKITLGKLLVLWCPQCNKARTFQVQGYLKVCTSCRYEFLEYPDLNEILKGGKAIKHLPLNHITDA